MGRPGHHKRVERATLHLTKIEEFAAWVTSERSFRREPTKGEYEVLRIRLLDRSGDWEPVIFWRRNTGEQATTTDVGIRLVRSWLRSRRRATQHSGPSEAAEATP